jgi:hypothetical protein
MYDLRKDPDELTNLVTDAVYSELQSELSRRLAKLRDCKGAACRVGPRVSLLRKRCTMRVAGADARLVTSVSFSVRGRVRASDARAPFKAVIHARKGTAVTARMSFVDGRVVLRARPVARGCG